ncbi:ankyrin repeat domain-containing protein [Paenibacillus sp. H1-7]|uniref:ankyrin repeat domain-containing protein n=1 Tax=Paenibacillus sp. H1-7 TaxID=2282849 RepID=UPI001EF794F6|nr:ankyrin repeat domain-containing protein [Paenibacillus sp. H1-7]ULL16375.1 ankyrin repeat domain-containing protein [Paenibacillus sp. H1-7]
MEDTLIYLLIQEENIEELQKLITTGWNINKHIKTKYGIEFPLYTSISNRKYQVAKFLIEHGADLNEPENPPIHMAARDGNVDLISLLVNRGADVNIVSNRGYTTIEAATSPKNKYDVLEHLIKLGIRVDEFGGKALRSSAMSGDKNIVELLINHGADINYNQIDQVHTSGSTPLEVAVQFNKVDVAKLLLEKHAEVTITDCWGYRPYHHARINNCTELLSLIKEREPVEWHNPEKIIQRLLKYQVPEEVINFLQEGKKIELEDANTEFIRFSSLEEVRIFTWENKLVVDLVSEVENYDNTGFLVWLPEELYFATFDVEHRKFAILHDMTWSSLIENPGQYIDRILDWEYFEED